MPRPIALVVTLAAIVAGCSTEQVGNPTTLPSPIATTPPSTVATPDVGPSTVPDVMPDVMPDVVPDVVPEGFDRVRATVTKADGETCDVCLWVAETPEQRARGLMFVTDLGNADGMAFVYPAPRTGTFWMKNTVMPLSIAFFGLGGGYLGEFDMEPCTVDPCPRYRTAADFVVAVETNRGELAEVGIGPASSLELTDIACGA